MTVTEARAAQDAQIQNTVNSIPDIGTFSRAYGQGIQMRAQAANLGAEMQGHVLKNQAIIELNKLASDPNVYVTDPATGIRGPRPEIQARMANLMQTAGVNFDKNFYDASNDKAHRIYASSDKELTRPADGSQIIPSLYDARFSHPSIVPQSQAPVSAQGQQSIVPQMSNTPSSVAVSSPSQGTLQTPLQQPSQGLPLDNQGNPLPQPGLPPSNGSTLFSPSQNSIVPSSPSQAQQPQSIVPQGAQGPIPGYNGPILQGTNTKMVAELNDTLKQLQGHEGMLQTNLDRNDIAAKNNPHVMGWLGNMNILGIPERSANADDAKLLQQGDPGAMARRDREAARISELGGLAKNLTNRVTEKEIGLLAGALPPPGAPAIVWKEHYARSLALDQANEALIRAQLSNGGVPVADQQRAEILSMARRQNGLDDHNSLMEVNKRAGIKNSIIPQAQLTSGNAAAAAKAIPGSIVPQSQQSSSQGFDYNSIPSGAQYTAPDGSVRVKK